RRRHGNRHGVPSRPGRARSGAAARRAGAPPSVCRSGGALMALRPAMAKWFELLVAREELAAALQCLAGTREVELQAHSDTSSAALLPALRVAIAAAALQRVRSWSADADPLIDRLQRLARERSDLQLLERLLSQDGVEL